MSDSGAEHKDSGVFNTRGGPHDLGDPDDLRIRKVEHEVLIPKKIRQKTRDGKCLDESNAFGKCCKEAGLLNFVKCRQQNAVLRSCLERWYHDEDLRKECEAEYLKERSEYRRTGMKQTGKRV